MSDRYAGVIWIWGELKKAHIEKLIDKAMDEGWALSEEEIQKAVDAGQPLEYEGYDARYGQFEDLESFLPTIGLNYLRNSSAYYDSNPRWQACIDGEVSYQRTLSSGAPYMSKGDIVQLVELLEGADVADAAKLVTSNHGSKKMIGEFALKNGRIPTIKEALDILLPEEPPMGKLVLVD